MINVPKGNYLQIKNVFRFEPSELLRSQLSFKSYISYVKKKSVHFVFKE